MIIMIRHRRRRRRDGRGRRHGGGGGGVGFCSVLLLGERTKCVGGARTNERIQDVQNYEFRIPSMNEARRARWAVGKGQTILMKRLLLRVMEQQHNPYHDHDETLLSSCCCPKTKKPL